MWVCYNKAVKKRPNEKVTWDSFFSAVSDLTWKRRILRGWWGFLGFYWNNFIFYKKKVPRMHVWLFVIITTLMRNSKLEKFIFKSIFCVKRRNAWVRKQSVVIEREILSHGSDGEKFVRFVAAAHSFMNENLWDEQQIAFAHFWQRFSVN